MTAKLQRGVFVYVDYNVPGEPWHEFLIGDHVRGPYYTVKSPDDEFVHAMQVDTDVSGIRVGTDRWVLPAGLGAHVGAPVYRFPARVANQEKETFFAKTADLVAAWEADGGDDVTAIVPAAPPASGDGASAVDPLSPHGFAQMKFDDAEWIALVGDAEPGTCFARDTVRGQKVSVMKDYALLGDATSGKVTVLHKVTTGGGDAAVAAVAKVYANKDLDRTPRALDDARILKIIKNSSGKRYMDFASTVRRMKQEKFDESDWMLIGPRSAPYCLNEYARGGVGTSTRSTTWRHENSVQEESHHGVTHELISEALELFACVDQVDALNSAGIESLLRHKQYIEYEVKKRREAKKPADGAFYFRARSKATGGAVIDPALLKWIAETAARDSAILKEQRKAAEEQALARKDKGSKDGG